MTPRNRSIAYLLRWTLLAWTILETAPCSICAFARDGAHASHSSPNATTERVDALLDELWRASGVEPAPRASDQEFLRRVSLDLTGVTPRASQVRDFLASSPQLDADAPVELERKRSQLIDELLHSSRYATHMATVWSNRILPAGFDEMQQREALGLHAWLRARFAANLRYDNLVSGLLLTTGDDALGPGLFYRVHDVAPEKLASSAAELFLGVSLQCAQCHDHPFASWSQREFWGLAAFFAQVTAPSDRSMQATYRLVDVGVGEVTMPNSAEIVPPRYPKGTLAARDELQARREQLVFWLTSRNNVFLRRAAANWAWTHLFGQGLVESVDFPSGPEIAGPQSANIPPDALRRRILDELADHFAATGFDLRRLLGVIARTRAYQISSRHPAAQSVPPESFARMLPKPLTPEQLYDSFELIAPTLRQAIARDPAEIAPNRPGLDVDLQRVEFVRRMRSPPGNPTEYRGGTLQALLMMNGQITAGTVSPGRSPLLRALEAPFFNDGEKLDALFLATLSRFPDAAERDACLSATSDPSLAPDERRRAWSDVLWAAINSTEFAFNR